MATIDALYTFVNVPKSPVAKMPKKKEKEEEEILNQYTVPGYRVQNVQKQWTQEDGLDKEDKGRRTFQMGLAAGFATGFDVLVQRFPISRQDGGAWNDHVNFTGTVLNGLFDFRNAIFQRCLSGWKTCSNGSNGNVRGADTFQSSNRIGDTFGVDTDGTGG